MITLIHHPEGEKRVGDFLVENLQRVDWKTFRAAVAFAKRSGVKYLEKPLKLFGVHGTIKISVGIDLEGTSAEALTDLLAAVQPAGEVWTFHNPEHRNIQLSIQRFIFFRMTTPQNVSLVLAILRKADCLPITKRLCIYTWTGISLTIKSFLFISKRFLITGQRPRMELR